MEPRSGKTESWMRERFYARDRLADGSFVTGVLTTGIYCRPSCPARKPLPENLRFFPSQEEARRNGFRPCLRCRPDEPAAIAADGSHAFGPILRKIQSSLASLDDLTDLARAAQIGRTRLAELFRTHLQTTPARWLRRERLVRAAEEITGGNRAIRLIAADAGFVSDNAFQLAMRREFGVSPDSLRGSDLTGIVMELPHGFRPDLFVRAIERDRLHPSERAGGESFLIATASEEIEGTFRGGRLQLRWQQRSAPRHRWEIARAFAHRLGIAADPRSFERHATEPFRRVIGDRTGLRPVVMATPFDALLWAITGQVVSRQVAAMLRRRLVERTSRKIGSLYAPPEPRSLALHEAADLVRDGFTRAKARAIVDVSQRIASQALQLRFDRSIEEVRQELMLIPGIGRWTTEYVLLRGFGYPDVVPSGDAGLRSAIVRWQESKVKAGDDEIEESLEPFRGMRSFAVEHLWWWNDEQKRQAVQR